METNIQRWISPTNCPYLQGGRNLASLRRVEVRRIALRLELDSSGSKNDMLNAIIGKLGERGDHEKVEVFK